MIHLVAEVSGRKELMGRSLEEKTKVDAYLLGGSSLDLILTLLASERE